MRIQLNPELRCPQCQVWPLQPVVQCVCTLGKSMYCGRTSGVEHATENSCVVRSRTVALNGILVLIITPLLSDQIVIYCYEKNISVYLQIK